MKNIGIIGGFGPETTALFQLRLNDICLEKGVSQRPSILTWNTPVPLILEKNLILKGQGVKKFLPLLISAAKKLEESGSDFIVLPCNTLHVHFDDLQQRIKVPILNIIEESVTFLSKNNISKVGILGTQITVNSGMHANKIWGKSIQTITPSSSDQVKIDQIIHDVLNGKNLKQGKIQLKAIMNNLSIECDNNFLLACTDLQIILDSSRRFNIFDSMEILAQASVNHLLA